MYQFFSKMFILFYIYKIREMIVWEIITKALEIYNIFFEY